MNTLSPSLNSYPMVKLPLKSLGSKYAGLAFCGGNMKDIKFLQAIKNQLQKQIVPEFGAFSPITVIHNLEDKSRLTFTVQSLEDSNTAKKATFAFANAKSGKLAVKSKKFPSKSELEKYIDSIKEEDINQMLLEFLQKTK